MKTLILNGPKKREAYTLILNSLGKPQIAIRAFNLISTFSIDYGHEGMFNWRNLNDKQKSEIWNFWSKLFVVTFKNVPLEVFINSARFGASMTDAIKYLNVENGILVFNSWLERIDYQIKNDRILDEFEMAVANDLMELTQDNWKIRKNIFKRLVNYNDTSFVLSNLKWIVNYWDELDSSEKQEITNLLKGKRKDLRWIKAILLTCESPPNELCQAIVGNKDIFKRDIEFFLANLPDQLLSDCINVYCGFPQPLWWLAVHHNNYEFWGRVIRHIILKEKHPSFDICLQEFLSHGVNGFSEDWADWKSLWKQICQNVVNKKLLVNNLIYNTGHCTCNITITKRLWSILIDSYSPNEDEVIDLIVSKFEMLQQTGQKEDIFEFFDEDILNKIVLKLIPDSILINLLRIFKSNPFFKEEEKITIINNVIKITKNSHIRFFGTFNYISSLNKEDKIPDEVKTVLKSLPNNIDEIGKAEISKEGKKYEYKLDNWIGIN